MRVLLLGAVVGDVLLDLAMLSQGIASHDGRTTYHPIARAVIMSVLGGLAVLRRSRWALWTFVVVESLTACMFLFVAFFSPATGTLRFAPSVLLPFVVFGVLAVAAAVGGREQTPNLQR